MLQIDVEIFDAGPIIAADIEERSLNIQVSITGAGPPGIKGDTPQKGIDYWTDDDKSDIVKEVIRELPAAGGYKIGEGLKLADNVLSVDTVSKVEKNNTKPISSAAVYTAVGNIEVLLATI